MKAFITALILAGAEHRGIDPNMALAIATVESNLNPAAIGSLGEVGVFQLRPEFYLPNHKISIGEYIDIALDLMADKQAVCGKELLPSCWNIGVYKAKKLGVDKAKKGPYNTKIRRALGQIEKTCKSSN